MVLTLRQGPNDRVRPFKHACSLPLGSPMNQGHTRIKRRSLDLHKKYTSSAHPSCEDSYYFYSI